MNTPILSSWRRLAIIAAAMMAIIMIHATEARAVCTTYKIVTTGLNSLLFPITFNVVLENPNTGQTYTEQRVINSPGSATFPQPAAGDLDISQFDLKFHNGSVGLWDKYGSFPQGPYCSGTNNVCFTVSISAGITCSPTITLAAASCSGLACCPPPSICP